MLTARRREVSNIEERLAAAKQAVLRGHRLDIVGRRGSGRSHLLSQLDKSLRGDGWDTLIVRGVAPLQGFPLAALGLTKLEASGDRRTPPSFRSSATALRERAELGKFAILVDDYDQLDDASWGVVAAARKELQIPLAIIRLPLTAVTSAPPATASEAALTLLLGPLSFDDIEQIIETRLDGPVAGQLVSRVFAKSGGIPGVATAIVDAAHRAGHLVSVEGSWTVTGELWDPQLLGLMEAHLDVVTGEERDALEMLSWAGIVDIDTAGRLIGWETLEALENTTLLKIVSSGSRQLVVIVPPLLGEYFRHQPLSARRTRLTRQIAERLTADQQRPTDTQPATLAPFVSEPDALFIRLLQEQQAIARSIAQSNSSHARTLGAATDYLGELIDTSAPVEVIDAAFEASRGLAGDEEQTARFAILHAAWLIRAHHDASKARDLIQAVRARTGPYEGIIDAGLMILDTRLGRVDDDVEDRMSSSENAPSIVRGRLLEARTHAYITRGELTKARAAFAALQTLDDYNVRPVSACLGPLIEFGQGNLELAAEQAMRFFQDARERLDPNELRTAAYVATCAYSAMGRFGQVGDLLDTIVAMGEPSVPLIPETLAIHGFAAMVGYHTRHHLVGHHDVSDLVTETDVAGLLPGMHWCWSRSHQLAAGGDFTAGATLLWTEATALWERGGRLSGALGMLSAVEMDPNPDRLAIAAAHVAEIDSTLADAHCQYVTALVLKDGNQMITAAKALVQQGRLGPARLAYRFAETWLAAAGDGDAAQQASAARLGLFDHALSGDYSYRQFRTTHTDLTDRELEIGHLVVGGLTNPEIAARLVLSVRTVESHVHNIGKKLAATSRDDITTKLADYVDGTLVET
jgi:DNA-binding NarL/FixJ family response regulator